MSDLYELNTQEVEALKRNLQKVGMLTLGLYCIGRPFSYVIRIVNELLIRKEIFLLLEKKANFNELKPWLSLNEIVHKENSKIFRGYQYKTFQNLVKLITNEPTFCDIVQRKKILNTPHIFLRMKFLLNSFNLSEDLKEEILSFLRESIRQGYTISGKNIKGVLAGIIYICSRKNFLSYTQEKIAAKLDISTVTIRSRVKELKNFASSYLHRTSSG